MKSYNKLSVKISKPNILCGYLVVSFHFHRKCTLIRDAYFSVTTKKKPLQDHTLKENLLLLLHKSIWPCWYYWWQGVKRILTMTFPMTWCSHHILWQSVNNTEWQMAHPSYWVPVTMRVNYREGHEKKWSWSLCLFCFHTMAMWSLEFET
jgi:hypothetical protein